MLDDKFKSELMKPTWNDGVLNVPMDRYEALEVVLALRERCDNFRNRNSHVEKRIDSVLIKRDEQLADRIAEVIG